MPARPSTVTRAVVALLAEISVHASTIAIFRDQRTTLETEVRLGEESSEAGAKAAGGKGGEAGGITAGTSRATVSPLSVTAKGWRAHNGQYGVKFADRDGFNGDCVHCVTWQSTVKENPAHPHRSTTILTPDFWPPAPLSNRTVGSFQGSAQLPLQQRMLPPQLIYGPLQQGIDGRDRRAQDPLKRLDAASQHAYFLTFLTAFPFPLLTSFLS